MCIHVSSRYEPTSHGVKKVYQNEPGCGVENGGKKVLCAGKMVAKMSREIFCVPLLTEKSAKNYLHRSSFLT